MYPVHKTGINDSIMNQIGLVFKFRKHTKLSVDIHIHIHDSSPLSLIEKVSHKFETMCERTL